MGNALVGHDDPGHGDDRGSGGDARAADQSAVERTAIRVIAVAGAGLGGFGVLLWIAAHWSTLGRFGHFGLLQGLFVAALVVALLWRPLRIPMTLVAFIGIGGLFALFGQTYQTGADPWQLFALWALLALPLCIGVRSDVLWAPWSLVAMVGVSLWIVAHTGHRFRVDAGDLRAHGLGWMFAVLITAALSPALARITGAGVWARRTSATLAMILVTTGALAASFGHLGSLQYALGLVVLAVAVVVFALPETYDLYSLSGAALGLNVLVIAGIAHALFSSMGSGTALGSLILIGLIAAGLLAATVSGVLRISRARQGAAP